MSRRANKLVGISQETAIELYQALSNLVCAVCPPDPKSKQGRITINVNGVEVYFKEPIEKAIAVLNKVRKESTV